VGTGRFRFSGGVFGWERSVRCVGGPCFVSGGFFRGRFFRSVVFFDAGVAVCLPKWVSFKMRVVVLLDR